MRSIGRSGFCWGGDARLADFTSLVGSERWERLARVGTWAGFGGRSVGFSDN